MVHLDNLSIIKEFWDNLNSRNYSVIDKYCEESVSSFSYGISRAKTNNKEEYLSEFKVLFRAFPDYKLEIYKMIANQYEVWVYGMQNATQQNDFYGIPATNNKFEIAFFSIYELKGGKIISETILTDTLKLYQELGQAVIKSQDKEKLHLYLKHLTEIGLIPYS